MSSSPYGAAYFPPTENLPNFDVLVFRNAQDVTPYATNAGNVNVTNTTSGATYYPTFVDSSSGYENIRTNNPSFTYNANTNTISANTSGTASTAVTASNIALTSDDTSGSYWIPFSKTNSATSNTLYIDDTTTTLSYNPFTSTLSANNFNGNASTATTATNIAGGAGGSIPYQSATSTTALLANGTAGQLLQSNGTTLAPSWITPAVVSTPNLSAVLVAGNSAGSTSINMNSQDITSANQITATQFNGPLNGNASTATTASACSGNSATATLAATATNALACSGNSATATTASACSGNSATATTATNIAGGAGGSIPYQSATSTTALLANGTAGQLLQSNGTTLAPSWVTPAVGSTPNLSAVLVAGNSAGSTSINMNNNAISSVSTLGVSSTSTFGDTVSINIAAAGTAKTGLGVTDTTLNNNLRFIPSNTSGNLNPFANPGSSAIIALNGTIGNQPLEIYPWSANTVGLRLTGTSALIGAGGTTSFAPTSSISFAGTSATMTGNLNMNTGNITNATAITATTFTGTLSGNASSATTASACSGNSATATTASACSGNSATATTATNALACSGNSATATTASACSGNSATATTASACSGNSATATTATNIAGGAGGEILYQSSASNTAKLTNGTAGQLLQSNGTTLAPSWITPAVVSTPNLSAVLVAGNSAGSTSINMNSQSITNVSSINNISYNVYDLTTPANNVGTFYGNNGSFVYDNNTNSGVHRFAVNDGLGNQILPLKLSSTGIQMETAGLTLDLNTGSIINGSLTGNASSATKVNLSNTASSATNYLVMCASASGSAVDLLTDNSGATYDSVNNIADINITANAGSATEVNVTVATTGTWYPVFVNTTTSGNKALRNTAVGFNFDVGNQQFNTVKFNATGSGQVTSTFTIAGSTPNITTNTANTLTIKTLASTGGNIELASQGTTGLTIAPTEITSPLTQPAATNSSTKIPTTAWVQSAITAGTSSSTNAINTTTLPITGTYYFPYVANSTGTTNQTPYADGNISFDRTNNTLSIPNLTMAGSILSTVTITNGTSNLITTGNTVNLTIRTQATTGGNVVIAPRGTTALTLTQTDFSTPFNNITLSASISDNLRIGYGSSAAGNNLMMGKNVPYTTSFITNTGLNTIIGNGSGTDMVNGAFYNTLVGHVSGGGLKTGTLNVFVGMSAGFQSSGTGGTGAGSYNTAVGAFAGQTILNSASNNCFLGTSAGRYMLDQSYNTCLGSDSGTQIASNNNTFVGGLAGPQNAGNKLTGTNNVAVGYKAGTEMVGAAANNTFVGNEAGEGLTTGIQSTFIGGLSGFQTGAAGTGSYNTCVGYASGTAMTGAATENTLIGTGSGIGITTGNSNTFVGTNAGFQTTTATENSFFGKNAGFGNTTGLYNTFLGYGTGFQSGASGNTESNTCVGYRSGAALIGGARQNTFVGVNSGNALTFGIGHIIIGYNAGIGTTSAAYNVFIGNESGNQNPASPGTNGLNVCVGYQSGKALTGVGSLNTFIGGNAGDIVTTGQNNICIGYNSDPPSATISNTISIGTATETMYIKGGLNFKIGPTITNTTNGNLSSSVLAQYYNVTMSAASQTITLPHPSNAAYLGAMVTFKRKTNTTQYSIAFFSGGVVYLPVGSATLIAGPITIAPSIFQITLVCDGSSWNSISQQ